jgi:hypothetical protein
MAPGIGWWRFINTGIETIDQTAMRTEFVQLLPCVFSWSSRPLLQVQLGSSPPHFSSGSNDYSNKCNDRTTLPFQLFWCCVGQFCLHSTFKSIKTETRAVIVFENQNSLFYNCLIHSLFFLVLRNSEDIIFPPISFLRCVAFTDINTTYRLNNCL